MSFFGLLNKHERAILKNVKQHGCHVWLVFDPEGVESNFAYSVGFTQTVGHSEVIIFGLSDELMHTMINETMSLLRNGLRMHDGMRIDGLLEGHCVVARSISSQKAIDDHLVSAIWIWRRGHTGSMPTPFQLVWPGAVDGLFPWDEGCDASVIDLQPALYEQGALQ